ncbi:F0F1 ATP synthase subunit epsilon [Pseudofrankia inefficax]|uniref:ATP synthase epsilon chain n=1 Tax=Pseudofrankia inefficax (strain DSM 45817 / CECT 9037 / DDB 130130 / EuI1c) TaxID=298654 RepID=E3IXJ7_PSEI1|nr:F0F1 ATP synthase subunit epsilon [Pseudofrankia inefficax]ADP79014.1 ATPase, F1 complex, delta/epsilon subunit-like protein [Pseudofrankia inefficax]
MPTMRVAVVSPEEKVWEGEANFVLATTTDGDLGVWPRHVPLLGVLKDGADVKVETPGGDLLYTVGGGFISVTHDGVSILAESAALKA